MFLLLSHDRYIVTIKCNFQNTLIGLTSFISELFWVDYWINLIDYELISLYVVIYCTYIFSYIIVSLSLPIGRLVYKSISIHRVCPNYPRLDALNALGLLCHCLSCVMCVVLSRVYRIGTNDNQARQSVVYADVLCKRSRKEE
jgi:hypothetical protein